MLPTVRVLLPGFLFCSVTALAASNAAIGLAAANGTFQVNSAAVTGNATLFEGTLIETSNAPSHLQLHNGADIRLATDSRARVYGDRATLEKGYGQLESSSSYTVEANSLRVVNATPGSIARVQLTGQGKVVITALRGSVKVANGAGFLVSDVAEGTSRAFDPQAGAAGPSKVNGCLFRKDQKLYVVDTTTNVRMEVTGGPDLEKEVGNHVELSGAQDVTTQILNVSLIKRISKGCRDIAGAAVPGGGAAKAGMSATTVAIIGGVAVAGTLTGLGISGTFSGETVPPSTSR